MKIDTDAVPIRRIEDLPELATRRELAEFTGVSAQTFARWAVENRGPAMTKLGSAARYRRADVLSWIDSSRGVQA